MSTLRRIPTPVRAAVTAIASLALFGSASSSVAAHPGRDAPPARTAGAASHSYRLVDGVLHATVGSAPAAPPVAAGPARGTDLAETVLVWSQFSADFSGIHLMVARGDGTGARELTTPTAGVWDLDPRISPDNRSVLFERDTDDGIEVVVMGIDGQQQRVLPLGCEGLCVGDVAPTWGPDGTTVWFTRVLGPFDEQDNAASAVLWAADLTGTNVHQVTADGIAGPYEEYSAKFLPDGDRVIIRLRNADGATALVRVDQDGLDHVLTDWAISADIFDVSPAQQGPTAGLVVFETYGHGAPDGVASAVATVPSHCVNLTACMARLKYLTPTVIDPIAPADNYNPVWSPDGRRIAYVHAFYSTDANPDFGADIWAMSWKGSHSAQLTDAAEWDFRPDWGALPSD